MELICNRLSSSTHNLSKCQKDKKYAYPQRPADIKYRLYFCQTMAWNKALYSWPPPGTPGACLPQKQRSPEKKVAPWDNLVPLTAGVCFSGKSSLPSQIANRLTMSALAPRVQEPHGRPQWYVRPTGRSRAYCRAVLSTHQPWPCPHQHLAMNAGPYPVSRIPGPASPIPSVGAMAWAGVQPSRRPALPCSLQPAQHTLLPRKDRAPLCFSLCIKSSLHEHVIIM